MRGDAELGELVAGEASYVAGTHVWTDYAYDDRGPNTDPLPGGDAANRAAVAGIQRDGTCWLGGTTWRGAYVLRISFANWATSDEDVDRCAAVIADVAARAAG